MKRNREVHFVGMGREFREGSRQGAQTEEVKMIKMPYLYAPISEDECNYYVSQIYTKNKINE